MSTELLFLQNTFFYKCVIAIQDIGEDEHGYYFIPDKTIFHPQGGGQPNDLGWITLKTDQIKIVKAKYDHDMCVRHYIENPLNPDFLNEEITMQIDSNVRKLHAAYHTLGHWLSQIIYENLKLPLFPIKGHHIPGEAYIEFDGDLTCISDEVLDNIKLAIDVDLQYRRSIHSEFVIPDSPLMKKALLPKNFKPPTNKPMRLVTIEGYRPIPCGGTHYDLLNNIKSGVPTKIYTKRKKARLSYTCIA